MVHGSPSSQPVAQVTRVVVVWFEPPELTAVVVVVESGGVRVVAVMVTSKVVEVVEVVELSDVVVVTLVLVDVVELDDVLDVVGVDASTNWKTAPALSTPVSSSHAPTTAVLPRSATAAPN
jgi:hypothetical protein